MDVHRGFENYPGMIDEIARIRPLVGNVGAVVRAGRDPVRFGAVVQKAGLGFPEIRRVTEGGTSDGAWLVKARRSVVGWVLRLRLRSKCVGCRADVICSGMSKERR